MRPGIPEIALIMVIIVAAAVIMRISRAGGSAGSEAGSRDGRPRRLKQYFKGSGLLLIIGGIALAALGMSVFRWALQAYWAAFVIALLGLLVLFLSSRK